MRIKEWCERRQRWLLMMKDDQDGNDDNIIDDTHLPSAPSGWFGWAGGCQSRWAAAHGWLFDIRFCLGVLWSLVVFSWELGVGRELLPWISLPLKWFHFKRHKPKPQTSPNPKPNHGIPFSITIPGRTRTPPASLTKGRLYHDIPHATTQPRSAYYLCSGIATARARTGVSLTCLRVRCELLCWL